MAILIKRNTKILGVVDTSTLYVRSGIKYDLRGDRFEIFNQVYYSREGYDLGVDTNSIKIDEIPYNKLFYYDRMNEGNDLLYAAHVKLKNLLSTDITEEIVLKDSTGNIVYNQIPVLDPSTGEQLIDETGDPIWEVGDPSTIIIIKQPKFAEDTSIFFIDIE